MMPLTFVMVCEAQADFRTASIVADRMLCESVDWIEEQVLDSFRQYKGTRQDISYLSWSESARLSKALGRRVHGHFEGKPGDLDALAGRKAILVVLTKVPDVKVVFLIRDSDGFKGRVEGLQQARGEIGSADCAIIIGVAHCKREAWVLAAFEALNAEEQGRIDSLRKDVGFHPCEQSHNLNARHGTDKRSAKRVLHELIGGDKNREWECLTSASLTSLRQRGCENGLESYLDEIERYLIPLFSTHKQS